MLRYSKGDFCFESDDGEFLQYDSVVLILGEIVANIVRDPRNIKNNEWPIIDPIYKKMDQTQWEEIICVARSFSKNIKTGPDENSRSEKRKHKEMHKILNIGKR